MVKVAPSMLASDFGRFAQEAQAACAAGADYLHMDIMDGAFVPNISFGADVVAAVHKACPDCPLDVHMMVNDPMRYAEDFVKAGASILTIHQEATPHLQRALAQIRALGVKAGLALNPATGLDTIRYVLDDLDLLLLMSVNPGFGGQKLLPLIYPKLREAKQMLGGRDVLLEVDGGANASTARLLEDAGATMLVAGSAVFGAPDRKAAIELIRG